MRATEFITEYRDAKDPAFLKWFGNSKVVDGSGDPLMLFHGTLFKDEIKSFHDLSHFGTSGSANQRIDDLMKQQHRGMQHVGQGKEQPHVYPVFLKIENPLKMPDLGEWWDSDVWFQIFANEKLRKAVFDQYGSKVADVDAYDEEYELVDYFEEVGVNPWEWLASQGFDGFYYVNAHEDAGNTSWVPFSGKQVMSAFR